MHIVARKVDAGPQESSETTNQQRQEGLQKIAEILLDIFSNLTPEERSSLLPEGVLEKAA